MKMRKLMIFAFLMAAAGMIGGGYAQEMPVEVKRFLENYLKDSTAMWGPLEYKPASVQIKDLRLRALQVYKFKNISLDRYPDTVALSEVIEPDGFWRVGVMVNNRVHYTLVLDNRTGKPEAYGVRGGLPPDRPHSLWDPLLEAYPESTGIDPVLLITNCEGYHLQDFLYFKQKGPRKIYYSGIRKYNHMLDSLFPASIETLDDSKKLVNWQKWVINEIRRRENERKRLEKTKAVGSDEDSKPKEVFFPSNRFEAKGSVDFKDIVLPNN